MTIAEFVVFRGEQAAEFGQPTSPHALEQGYVFELQDIGGASYLAELAERVPTAANVADALAALRLLATHPRIDPERIGVIGFSKGGQVALYTALEPFRRAIIDDDRRFAAHVALYPYCNDWYQAERIDGAPMLLLLGGRDDYTPAEPCRGYAEWFRSAGADTSVITRGKEYARETFAYLYYRLFGGS
jgi:dienelactone hydrolase